jgi:mRNA interferase YafQ
LKNIIADSCFKASWKKLQKKKYNRIKLDTLIKLLEKEAHIPGKYRDHPLSGNYAGFRECHIEDDWLLVYKTTETEIILVKTCTHDDL